MKPFTTVKGIVVPFPRTNIDTDAMLPNNYLKKLEKFGYGDFLFDDERYLTPGDVDIDPSTRRKNPSFILNQTPYNHAEIVVTGANFGCGSSREHAVWALRDFGIRAIIAPSFGDIFWQNCFNNGLLPITLSDAEVKQILAIESRSVQSLQLTIDLDAQTVATDEQVWSFEIDANKKAPLLAGLDSIGETLREKDAILQFEQQRRQQRPWLFQSWD